MWPRNLASGLLIVLTAWLPTPALAQLVPNAGSELRAAEQEGPRGPTAPSATLQVKPPPRAAPLLESDDPDAPEPEDGLQIDVAAFKVNLTAIEFEQLQIDEAELQEVLAPFVGPGKTFDDLLIAADTAADYLHAAGYFLAQVYLPPQRIEEDGIVQLAVLAGRLGRWKVLCAPGAVDEEDAGEARDSAVEARDNAGDRCEKGDLPVSMRVIESMLSVLEPGSLIRENFLERVLFLLGDLRGLTVKSVLRPGTEPGTADLVITLAPDRRFYASAEYDNYGSRFTSGERIGLTADWNNPFGLGDSLLVRGLFGINGDLSFGRVSYLVPVGPYGTKVGGAYARLDYDLGTSEFAELGGEGSADVGSLFALHPIVRGRSANLFASAAFDFRSLSDEFESLQLVNDRDLRVGMLTLLGDGRDRHFGGGINTFAVSGTFGDVDIVDPLAALIDESSIGRGVAGFYMKANLSFSRLQQLGGGFLGYVDFRGQWASKNLDSNEKISLGGPYAVRAYAEGEAASDRGWLLTAELRRPIPLPARWQLPGNLVASGFVDVGVGDIDRDPRQVDIDNTRELVGAGFGLSWGRSDNFLVRATVAWRVTGPPIGDPEDEQPRVYFRLSKSF